MRDFPSKPGTRTDRVKLDQHLQNIADYNGVPFGRLARYWEAESQHIEVMRVRHDGSLMISRTFQCFFLETIELLNKSTDTIPQDGPAFYTRFVAKLVHVFQQLCASELLAMHGYPFPAFAQLRNIFDHLVLISAAMQKLTDLFEIEGIEPDKAIDQKKSKQLRKKAESRVRESMTGKFSGLSEQTAANLIIWNDLFDFEVHGSKLSLGIVSNFVHGTGRLAVFPEYKALPSINYATRTCEITWMTHRLVPLLQHSTLRFPDEWRLKWDLLDEAIETAVRHFADQQEQKVSLAIVELVNSKFPFSARTAYPLETFETDLED